MVRLQEKVFYQKLDWQIGIAITLALTGLGIWASIDKLSFVSFFKWIYKNIFLSTYFWWFLVTLFVVLFRRHKVYKQKEKIESLEEELTEAKEEILILKSKTTPFIKRWEEILENGIRFGSLHYPPMLDFDNDGDPIGIGIDILKIIFNGKINKEYYRVSWQNLVKVLYEKDNNNKFIMDIIATPIFETNERSKLLSFSLPLFYSEIGLYYNCENKYFKNLEPKTFEQAIDFINNINNLNVICIEGELSHRMIKKHFEGNISRIASKNELSIQDLLATVIDDSINSDIVFAETYQAEKLIQSKVAKGENRFAKLKNLFKERQLLYPVVFAMRREDYVLKNYINLKLIELDGPGSGIIKLIKASLSSLGENIHDEDLKKYFIREYSNLTNSQTKQIKAQVVQPITKGST
ncbi:hypothetical protein Calab_1026 [Caldithrix abyssi DSM 13497]|uniref:ABC-type amino acid transport substrate-binding protein n=1 Tax=Caldithrix abyssi DSM 13497 TaxID=880073 RepID=H1XVT3_CALAY|nr:transporter substrate-binding domain-containing protein [Caldithrix abyssi]APF20872.1 ABC-type amino acid transport substrate-binding protein [Caldithrix abyssi DSM 13497]EHO40660.1 hypothetical protein Calab_1026 [Caldithrix abyssi DSM 13497]